MFTRLSLSLNDGVKHITVDGLLVLFFINQRSKGSTHLSASLYDAPGQVINNRDLKIEDRGLSNRMLFDNRKVYRVFQKFVPI